MATVRVDLLANISDALDGIKKFAAESTKSLNSINLKTTISAVRDFGAIASSVANAVTAAFEAPIAAASAQEDAVNSLSVALATNGNFTEKTIRSLSDYASAIQSTTKFSDDAVLSNLAFLESLTGLSEQGLQEASDAAINLAAALNLDLNTAFSLVAKSANGNTTALKRYGIEVVKGANDSETFANTLAAINRQFGGAAAGQIRTYSGAVALASNAFDDFLEEVGNLIIKNPVVISAINEAGKAFLTAAQFVAENRKAIIDFVNGGLVYLLKFIPFVIDSLAALESIFSSLSTSYTKLKNLFSDSAINRTAGGFVVAGDAAKKLNEQQDKLVESGKRDLEQKEKQHKAIQDALAGAKNFVNESIKGIEKTASASDTSTQTQIKNNKAVAESIRELTQEEKTRFDNLAKSNALFGLITASPEVRVRLADFGAEISKGMSEFQKNLTLAGAGLLASITRGAQGAKDLISGFAGNFAEALLPGLGGPVKEIVALLQEGPDAVRKMFTEFFQQLPKSLRNILDSIPVIIQTVFANLAPVVIEALIILQERLPVIIEESIFALIDGVMNNLLPRLPEIITRLSNLMPSVAVSLSRSLVAQSPFIARSLADGLVREAPRIAGALIEAIAGQATGGLVGGGGGGGIPGIGGLLGFAGGGDIPNVPAFQNDGGLAKVSAGESVLAEDTNSLLRRFLSQQGGGGGGGQTLTVNLVLGEEQLANAILNLNRQGFRLA